jgi:hypothetical protein
MPRKLTIHAWHPVVTSTQNLAPGKISFEGGTMSHRPMVHSEQPIKTRTLDRMHKAAHDALNKAQPKPVPQSQWARLDKLGIKKG